MVPIDRSAAHAVRHRQPPPVSEMGTETGDERRRVRKMRKRIVYHGAVEPRRERSGQHIPRHKGHARIAAFLLCRRDHGGRKIHGCHGGNVPCEVIRNQDARAAADVEHGAALFDAPRIQDRADDAVVAYKILVPGGCEPIEKSADLFLLHDEGLLFLRCLPGNASERCAPFRARARSAG